MERRSRSGREVPRARQAAPSVRESENGRIDHSLGLPQRSRRSFSPSCGSCTSSYCWWDATGACRTVPQAKDASRAIPFGPALFALGQHEALCQAAAKLHCDDALLAFLDDLFVVTVPELARAALDSTTTAVARRRPSRPTVASLPTSAKQGPSRWERPPPPHLRARGCSVLPLDTPSSCKRGRRSACSAVGAGGLGFAAVGAGTRGQANSGVSKNSSRQCSRSRCASRNAGRRRNRSGARLFSRGWSSGDAVAVRHRAGGGCIDRGVGYTSRRAAACVECRRLSWLSFVQPLPPWPQHTTREMWTALLL